MGVSASKSQELEHCIPPNFMFRYIYSSMD